MPVALKIILNILFYIMYLVVFSLIAWFVYAMTQGWVPDLTDTSFYNKFQIVMIFVVLVFTILLKKYFYIWLTDKEEIIIVED